MNNQSRQMEPVPSCSNAAQPRAGETPNRELSLCVSDSAVAPACESHSQYVDVSSQRCFDPSASEVDFHPRPELPTRSIPLQIFVRLPVGRTLTLSTKSDQTGKDLHNMLERKTGIAPNQQVLFYNNRKVRASKSLFEQSIVESSTLELSFALVGGSDEALSEKNLRRLARWLADMWRELAFELDMRDEEVRAIVADFPNGVVEQGFQMLCRWRQKSGISAGIPDLIAALREIEMNDIADKLLERLTGVPGPYSTVQDMTSSAEHSTSDPVSSDPVTSSHLTTDAATELPPALEEVAVSEQLFALAAESSANTEEPSSEGHEHTTSAGSEEAEAIKQSGLTVACVDKKETSTDGLPHESSQSAVPPNTTMLTKLESILSTAGSDSDNVNILIANAVPESLRGDQSLQFLLDFNWSAVLDFDFSSEDGGLRSLPDPQQSKSKIMEIKDFLEKSITNHPAEIGLHSKKKPWVFANGRKNVDSRPDTFVNWMHCGYRKALETALSTYQMYCRHLMFIILVLSANDLQHLASAVESLFCQQLTKQQSFYILSPYADKCRMLLELSRISKQLAPLCFVLPLDDIKAAFMNTRSVVSVASESIEEVRLPTFAGGDVIVPHQKVKKWDDLDVLSTTQCEENSHSVADIRREKENFYKGHEPTWLNFFHGHDIQRTKCAKYMTCIKEQLNDLTNMYPAGRERLSITSVRPVIINHQSGCGGTTVGRRLLWDLRKEYRCAVLTGLSDATRKAILDFQAYGESMVPQNQLKPLVLLADGHAVINLQRLLLQLDRGNVKCVVLCVQAKQSPPLVSHGRGSEHADVSHDLAFFRVGKSFDLPARLDKAELNRVKSVVEKLKGADGSQVVESVEQSKLFIYLGLELFGGNYEPSRLEKFVKYQMEAETTTRRHREMLRYCSLVYHFSRTAIPRGCFIFNKPGELTVGGGFEVEPLTSSVTDLLLLCNEQLDPPSCACYSGYRPAHALVAREILQQTFKSGEYTLPSLCHSYLKDMLQSTDYATRHLMDLTILLFRKREHSSEITEPEDESSPLEFLDQKHPSDGHWLSSRHNKLQRQNRYSPLITTVLTPDERTDEDDHGTDSKFDALKLIFSLCQTVTMRERDDTAYVWQLMARLLAYEYQEQLIPFPAAVQLTELLGPEAHSTALIPHGQDCQRVSGCTAAILCIDQAIRLLPNNTYCHATKGLIYKLKLQHCYHSQLQSGCSRDDLSDCVELAIKSGESYEKARINFRFNWHAYLGNIEAYVTLLEIAKNAPFFRQHEVVEDRNRNFLLFLEGKKMPAALADDNRAVGFIRSARSQIEHLFDKFFEQENTIREFGHGEDVFIKWMRSRERMNEMQNKFYAIVERKLQLDLFKDQTKHAGNIQWCEGAVRDMFFQRKETPYSLWQSMNEEDMQNIIQLLTSPVMRSAVERTSDFCKVAFVRACLECQERPSRDLESRLPLVVQQWVDHSNNFEWAHFFNYMLHFPHDNSLPCSGTKAVKRLLQACQKCVQKYGESKKSKPRYFIGPGKGLGAFVPARVLNMPGVNQPAEDYKTKTDFWRSTNVRNALTRLSGTKFKTGNIRYREDLIIKFDNALFPGTSQERVYFYIGFTFHGLYAFDPLSEDDLWDLLGQSDPPVNPPDEELDKTTDIVAAMTVAPTHLEPVGHSSDLLGAQNPKGNNASSMHVRNARNGTQNDPDGTDSSSMQTAAVRTVPNDQLSSTTTDLLDGEQTSKKLTKSDQRGKVAAQQHIQSELKQSTSRSHAAQANEIQPRGNGKHAALDANTSKYRSRLMRKKEKPVLNAWSASREEREKIDGKLSERGVFDKGIHSNVPTADDGHEDLPQDKPIKKHLQTVGMLSGYRKSTKSSFQSADASTDHPHWEITPAPHLRHSYSEARSRGYRNPTGTSQHPKHLSRGGRFHRNQHTGFAPRAGSHQSRGRASTTASHQYRHPFPNTPSNEYRDLTVSPASCQTKTTRAAYASGQYPRFAVSPGSHQYKDLAASSINVDPASGLTYPPTDPSSSATSHPYMDLASSTTSYPHMNPTPNRISHLHVNPASSETSHLQMASSSDVAFDPYTSVASDTASQLHKDSTPSLYHHCAGGFNKRDQHSTDSQDWTALCNELLPGKYAHQATVMQSSLASDARSGQQNQPGTQKAATCQRQFGHQETGDTSSLSSPGQHGHHPGHVHNQQQPLNWPNYQPSGSGLDPFEVDWAHQDWGYTSNQTHKREWTS